MVNQVFEEDFIATNLPKKLTPLDVAPVEDGGVMERFFKTVEEFPDEVTVISRKKASDYPASCERVFYIAPNGSDENTGDLEHPFATLARAVKAMDGKAGARIICRGGTYVLTEAMALDGDLPSSKDAPLFIEAYEGEKPVFTAANTVKGKNFAPVSEENAGKEMMRRFNVFSECNTDNIYVADLFSLGFTQEMLGKITVGGSPILYIDGEAQTLVRYPNKNARLLKVYTGEENILKQCKVTTATSKLYLDHKEDPDGWKLQFTEDNEFFEHASMWKYTPDMWFHAALYQEWHRWFYPVTLTAEADDTITVESAVNCSWGLLNHRGNNGYFANIPEELDCEGEWYLDRNTGKLYIWREEPLSPDAQVSLITARHNLFDFKNLSYVVLDGMTFWGTLGYGLAMEDCHDMLVQNCRAHDTMGSAFRLERVQNTAVIFCELYHTNAAMLFMRGLNQRRDMIPDRNIVQNCRFHTPIVQSAIEMHGVMCAATHNYLRDTVIGVSGTVESIYEYNEFDRASQITFDSGPFYCSGMGVKGLHMRYNYFHDINKSRYGIYIDDLACANYAYGNIFVYARENSGGGKCINIHSGNQNVVYNNVCVNAPLSAIKDDINYYVHNVKGPDGEMMGGLFRTISLQETTDEYVEWGGALGYRWIPMSTNCANAYETTYFEGSAYASRLPNTSRWAHELHMHKQNREAMGDAYDCNAATFSWTPRTDTKYPWGDQSLSDFLASCPDSDRELYLRSPAYNAYINNVFLGCRHDIEQYTLWGVLTCDVHDNYGFSADDERFEMALDGNVAPLAKAETWRDVIPNFKDIPFEKIGLTE